jgi:hypothetical protein
LTLTLRPRGRGNWSPVTLVMSGRRAQSLFIQCGQTLFLGGVVWRIVKVAA